MRLSQAEALCPDARFLPADQGTLDAVHDALIDAAKRFTPTVETAGLGLAYADVSGVERRFDSEAELVQQLSQDVMEALALDVQVGLAGNAFAARQAAQAAQAGRPCVVPDGKERAFLSPLDISTLALDPEMERRLRLLGVRTLGALAKLPRPAVVRQFGSHAGPLHDLACGLDPRPVHGDAPPLHISRSRAFEPPISRRATLLAHVQRMVSALAEEMDRRGYQAEGVRLTLEEESGRSHASGKAVKPPSAAVDKLARLAARLLGEVTVDGPVAELALTVYPLRPFHLGATQLALFDDTPGEGATFSQGLREVLRRLRDRFGDMIVVIAALVTPPRPRPILVTTDARGAPCAVVWRERIRQVRCIYGLWRERRRWWARPIERDYFRLELDDGQMRVIFRDVRTDRWSLERRHV